MQFNKGRLCGKLIEVLTNPFRRELPFFIITLIFISVPSVYFYLRIKTYPYVAYVLMASVCTSYALTFIVSLKRCGLTKWLKVLFTAVSVLYLILNLFCIDKFNTALNWDFIAVILGTNADEAVEFLETFVDVRVIVMLAVFVAGSFILAWAVKKIRLSTKASYICLIIVLCCTAPCLRNTGVWKDTFFGRIASICKYFSYYSKAYNLREYYTSPALTDTRSTHPENVVLVIGESFSKVFSSLYAYEKETNPKLEVMKDCSLLYVYDNIKSPATNTINAFKHFMTTWRGQTVDDKDWYNCTTIPEINSLCGYKSYWISNQSKRGFCDNVIGNYADLCDCSMFVGNKFAGMSRHNVDEEVLPLIKHMQKNTARNCKRNFYFIHLMGSHEAFEARFPADRKHFKASEYLKYPEKQRKTRADYDNSILYNDSVVSEIIKQFEDKEAVIVYFSDHALDVYQSSDNYFGHAKAQEPASKAAGEAIPFMVYVTRKYQQAYPDMTEKIRLSAHKKFSTDNLIYTVMDIIGVKFAANNDVARFSLFSSGQ